VEGLTDAVMMQAADGGKYPNYHSPNAINQIYNFTGLRNANFDGTGQKIAIYSLADYNSANLAYYAAYVMQWASPPLTTTFNVSHVTRVSIANGDGTSGTTTYSIEADLDTQLCLGSVPGANIQIWLAKNGTMGMYNIYSQFANQTAVKILTSSWGIREDAYLPSDSSTLDAYHALFAQAASEGLNIFNSTGDNGSRPASSRTVGVSHPSCDPYVVAVGGTTLTTGTGDLYGSEIGWGGTDTSVTPHVFYGSGGGVSTYFPQPSWQTGPGVSNSHSNGYRQLPDISMDADANTGYFIRMMASDTSTTPAWYLGGGTSASAPEWACGTLLLEQAVGKAFFLPPLLYTIYQNVNAGAPFHDVLSGTNGDYNCTTGWDYVTGMGSADFGALLTPLAALVNTLRGDVNLDGKVDMNDAKAGLQIVAGLATASAQQVTNGAVLGTGTIQLADVVTILKGL
jgi:kumamolisin